MIIARFAKHVFVWKMSDDYLDQFWIFLPNKKNFGKICMAAVHIYRKPICKSISNL